MITDNLKKDQINSMKSGNKKRLEVLRYILAQIKNREIDTKKPLSDEEVILVFRKQYKELSESIEAFEKGGRADLVEECRFKMGIISEYLPSEISDEELEEKIKSIIENNKSAFEKNKRSIIGICVKELGLQVDPSRISGMLLSKKFDLTS